MSSNYHVVCLSEAVSPITHAMGTEGNESIIMREPVVSPIGLVSVPCLSGNALRHRCVRQPGSHWLIQQYELAGTLTRDQLNFLLHGGNLTEGGGREMTAVIADMHRLFPLYKLLGGSLPSQILAGRMLTGRGVLVCEENRRTLDAILPTEWTLPKERLRSAESFVSGYQYTRGDGSKTASDMLRPPEPDDETQSNLMIFSGQAVARGSLFVHDFTLPMVSRLELGALLHSLAAWQYIHGGTIGGQAARGHGKLHTSTLVIGEDNADSAIQEYTDYAVSVKDDAVALLRSLFAPAIDRPAKGKKKAAATA